MSLNSNTDNIYKEGTIITAKVAPGLNLKVMRYYHRIYYCASVDGPTKKYLAYFERELTPLLIV
jgi:hypothetical protein